MSLQDWLKNGWITEHKTSREEILDLLDVINRDLSNCQIRNLSPDWQMNIAYNAVLQTAVAGLAAAGYRTSREAQHYRTIQSLAFTLHIDSRTIADIDAFRKKRNISEYERAGRISDQEVNEMIALASRLRNDLLLWLKKEHSELLSEDI